MVGTWSTLRAIKIIVLDVVKQSNAIATSTIGTDDTTPRLGSKGSTLVDLL